MIGRTLVLSSPRTWDPRDVIYEQHQTTPTTFGMSYHFDYFRRDLKLDFYLLACRLPGNPHKLQLLGMVWEGCVGANKASVNGDGDGEYFLAQIIIALGLRASLALVNLLCLCHLGVVFVIRRMGAFLTNSSGQGIGHVILTVK